MHNKADAELQQDVLDELKWDRRVEENEVGVQVESGVVVLAGWVDSWAKRAAAAAAAHRVGGVRDVVNNLRVRSARPGAPSDVDIALAVRHALAWNVFVPEHRIRSTVSDGRVTLEGEVESGREREDAERAVRDLKCVRWVRNNIVVHAPKVSPARVRESIEHAIARQTAAKPGEVSVEVHGSEVTLRGRVGSELDRQTAVRAARATPGVQFVTDHLLASDG